MSTFMANKGNIERKWYVIDAAGKPMGKTAVAAADLLRGKLKVTYTPHADCGDNVIIINAAKAVLTGNKMEQKYYRTHSGWVGGLRTTALGDMLREKPERLIMMAVRGMLPKNKLGHAMLKKLKVYAGPEHPHAAQNPQPLTLSL